MRWIYRRLITAALTVFVTTNLIFFLIRLMPGNIIDSLIGFYVDRLGMTYTDAYRLLSASFGIALNKPLHEQYASFLYNIFTGKLGESIGYGRTPVINIIAKAIPWTVLTVTIGLLTSFLAGILFGLLAAYKHDSAVDNILKLVSTFTTAIPNYIFAYAFIIVLSSRLNLFPMFGAYDAVKVTPSFSAPFILNVLHHAALPILSYFVANWGGWVLYMRSNTVSVLGEDYVLAAKARALSEFRIAWMYVGRNAMLPLFTMLAISIGYIFGGSTLIEYVFTYPGIGFYISRSVGTRDYPLMQGLFLVITVAVTISNLMADVVYSRLDPRVRFE